MVYPNISEEIISMAQADQKMRTESQNPKMNVKFNPELDKQNTFLLKKIIREIGWPTISKVGKEASYAAWLIVQHADHDVVFQEKCLQLMLKSRDDILPSNIAYLTDRVAVNEKKPQTYGTQFYQDKKGNFKPRPIKSMKGLEAKRQQMGLEPYSVYEQKMRGEYKWPKNYKNPKVGRLNKSS